MRPRPTSLLVLFALTLLFVVLAGRGFTWPVVGVALASSAVYLLGAWLAPAGRGTAPAFSGSTAWEKLKSLQLVVGGLVAAVTMLLVTRNPGTGALLGIIAAVLVGALSSSGEADSRPGVEATDRRPGRADER